MGWRSPVVKRNVSRSSAAKYLENEITELWAAPNSIVSVRSGHRARGCSSRYQRMQTMVMKFLDHQIPNRNFEVRNHRIATGTLANQRGKGRRTSEERPQGNLLPGGSQRQLFQGRLMRLQTWVSMTKAKKWAWDHSLTLLHHNQRETTKGRALRKSELPE